MTRDARGESLPELLEELPREFSEMVRGEIELAKAEISEKLAQAMEALGILVLGAIFAVGALAVLVAAATGGTALVLSNRGFTPMEAGALGAAIVGAVFAVLAGILIWRGLVRLKASRLELALTARSLDREADTLRKRL